MLRLEGVEAGYGPATVLRGVSLQAAAGQITCIMGRNGAGKSTLMKCIMGLVPARSGSIFLGTTRLDGMPAHRVPYQGVAYVPQGRRLFGPMTVAENLDVGLLARHGDPALRARVLSLFPRVQERLSQPSATLSGGEQQMLAIARALCLAPQVILLDEPTEGLQPSMVQAIRAVMLTLRAEGVAVVLVEQRVEAVLGIADHVAFMAHGRVEDVLPVPGLTAAAPQFKTYVGV